MGFFPQSTLSSFLFLLFVWGEMSTVLNYGPVGIVFSIETHISRFFRMFYFLERREMVDNMLSWCSNAAPSAG